MNNSYRISKLFGLRMLEAIFFYWIAQSAGAVEYTNCLSTKG